MYSFLSHAKRDEHVLQAAGVIPIAHASGGPLRDIIVPFNGLPTGWGFAPWFDSQHLLLYFRVPRKDAGRFRGCNSHRIGSSRGRRAYTTSPGQNMGCTTVFRGRI